ncbi:DUF2627 domain-containing protein [Virgibacillus sp. W0181]|uniref:DUF2627 domain-containing protein n=1 Tax=Virgibacillus sp. W0181 TaxID=3391581 RepID=UPI003F48E07C
MARIIAVIILFIPGVIGAYGIKLMRDSLFGELYTIFFHLGLQFFIGFLLFAIGLSFIGGFILHRDKKKQLYKKRNNNNTKDG